MYTGSFDSSNSSMESILLSKYCIDKRLNIHINDLSVQLSTGCKINAIFSGNTYVFYHNKLLCAHFN